MYCRAMGLCQILEAKGGKSIPPACGGLLQERRQGRISLCEDYFSQAFKVLSVNENVTAVFMPCSTSERYYRRFAKIAHYLERYGYALSGLHLIEIIRNRESKHTAAQRSSVDTANYSMSLALQGKKVVIVDDLFTTGSSLTGFVRNLERVGAEVIGAVFLARTFQVPSWRKIRWMVWKRHLLCK